MTQENSGQLSEIELSMPLHKLDLQANALDSFNEAIAKYREAQGGNIKAYKFAILHLAHALELLFKLHVANAHPLLIYKNPFSKNLDKEQTIGLWEAVQFLKNEGTPLDIKFVGDLEWLKNLRNQIEHRSFEMEVAESRRSLGRLVQAISEFCEEVLQIQLKEFVEGKNAEVFDVLSNEYSAELDHAKLEAKESTEDNEVQDCDFCGNEKTVAHVGQSFVCKFCNEVDNIIQCCICGVDERRSIASLWNDDDGNADYACESCINRIREMN